MKLNRVRAELWPAAVRVADQLSGGGREAQIVGEAVFRRGAQVVLPLLSRHLSSSLNKQDAEEKHTEHPVSGEHLRVFRYKYRVDGVASVDPLH